ncbi:MAG TPA: alcohol dehydrogenase catalytic domain-containing protein, partial [Bacteroidota bacterium]|nr:alcohol dehydrogenase catalytic domain-containing protein [Bacteroidota bacterium]
MKAALYTEPHHIAIVVRELRPLQQGEALVQIHACGICGTDLHIIEGTSHSRPPVVLGHEFAGLVLDLAGEYPGIRVGTRVAVDPNISCGVCYYCRRGSVHLCSNLTALGVDRDGGMAEFCIVPVQQLHALPDTVAFETGVLVEPVSCALHGIDRAGIRTGDSVVIIGGGTIGLLMLQLARHAGATRIVVVEPAEHKRKAAETLGADVTLDPLGTDIRSVVFDLTSVGA